MLISFPRRLPPRSFLSTTGLIFACTVFASSLFATPTKHVVPFADQSLALWEKRAENPQRTLLLLHGSTWSALPNFDLQVPGEKLSLLDAFAARGYAVYALDLPGYGQSPRLASGWLSPDEAADALAAALQWITQHSGVAGAPTVLGWSKGSRVAQLTAQRHPELISNLILLGYPGDPDKRETPLPEPAQPLREPTNEKRARSDFITPGSISAAATDAYVAAALAADPIRTDWRRNEQWNELDPAQVRVPVLLLHGEHDPVAKADAQARFFTRLGNPDRRWVVLPGGDHAALIEHTQPAFVAVIDEFIARPPRGGQQTVSSFFSVQRSTSHDANSTPSQRTSGLRGQKRRLAHRDHSASRANSINSSKYSFIL